ncbi:MAG TPA: HAD family hydrolase [Syntrophorhabdales bacterium]|nr:HAD family hydrolase [Syntrophorhabdales bacterium]
MVTASIPGWGELELDYLLVDFNGTTAFDGQLKKGVKELFDEVSKHLKVIVVSADTYDSIDKEPAGNFTVVKVGKLSSGIDKGELVRQYGPERVVAIGNGANDAMMLREAALGIAIIGEEGAAASLLKEADIVVTDIAHALGLMLQPARIVATLRE